ncbi:hypothetical protein [Leucobacter iarius]|uniref:arsenate reductase/protein-tyrosine-phosphatase family protein n=1 Tax=Leucobacter iarius TaxID=333963 RepID=UPI0031E12F28
MNPLRIHIVCTANVCRSPLAERLLAQKLEAAFPGSFLVSSSGTRADGRIPLDPAVVRELSERGLQPPEGRRPLGAQDLSKADLVLTMEQMHRGVVLDRWPQLLRRSFTLVEFARLESAAADGGRREGESFRERWASALVDLTQHRSIVPAGAQGNDVADPYGLGPERFAEALAQIESCLDQVLRFAKRVM